MPSVAQESTGGPDWLDASLMQEALRASGEDDVKVARIAAKLATAPGDNYASVLYRVTATLDDGAERTLLVKSPAPGDMMAQTIAEMGAFSREGAMLTRLLPEMEALLEETAPGRYPPLAPRCTLHGTTPVDFLVLEDLAPQDFKMADRIRGLGLRHSLFAFRSLARFHAASVALLAKDPSICDSMDNPIRKTAPAFEIFAAGALGNIAKLLRSWPGYEYLGDSLDAFKDGAINTIVELNDPKPGAFNVILHGDFWTNNMLFRYEKGKPKDIRLLDFQISHVGSPALDLLYILNTSISEDVSENYTDLLVREYHSTLTEVLTQLGVPAPSYAQLLADIDAHGPVAVINTTILMPTMKATKPPDLDAAMQDVNSITYLHDNPNVQIWLRRLLTEFHKKGWLPEVK